MLVTGPNPSSDFRQFMAETKRAIDALASVKLGAGASPTFADITVSAPSNIYALSHDSFADFVADEHVAHSGVTLTAGNGLTGGGDISASRSFDFDTSYSPTFAGLTLTGLSGVLKATAGVVAGSADHADLQNIGTDDHHDPVTLGTANGLTLSTQELSLPTSATPQFAKLGLGVAADATAVLYTKSTDYPVIIEERDAGSSTTGFWSVHDFTLTTAGVPGVGNMAVGILFNINGSGGDYNLGRIGCQQGDSAGQYGQLVFKTANNGAPSQWMVIKEDGKVGIGGSFLTPQARLDVYGNARIGDSTTNYVGFGTNGDLSFAGSAGFYPVRLAQSAQPTPDTGELVVWRDTDDGKVYLVYNDTDSGVKQVEMT